MNSRLHLPSLFLWSVLALAASVPWCLAESGPSAPAAVEGPDGWAGRQAGAEPAAEPSPEPSWDELRPDASDSDWIQLDSKEWLRGELKTIYKDKLEFDSENLGLLTIDMDDVIQIITHDEKSLFVQGRGVFQGRIDMKGDRLLVLDSRGGRALFPRRQVVSVAAGAEGGSRVWDGSVTVGINFSKGNTDQTEYNAKFTAKRRTPLTRYKLGYVGMVSKSEGRTISNNHRVTSSFDWYRTRHFFWRPFIGDLYVDTLQNIRYRILLGLGLGYDIIDTSRTTWTLFCGPAFQYTRFDHVSEGEDRSEYSPAFVFSSEYQVELNRISDLEMDYHGTLVNSKAGTYMHRFSTSLKNEILDDLDLDFTFIWDYIQNPQEDEDGDRPKKSDYKFMIGVGYNY